MSRATRAVVSVLHCASTFRQTKKKALLSKTSLDFRCPRGTRLNQSLSAFQGVFYSRDTRRDTEFSALSFPGIGHLKKIFSRLSTRRKGGLHSPTVEPNGIML